MGIRKLKFDRIYGLDSFKEQILQLLNIYDHKKQCIPEFEERIGAYLARNSKQVFEFTLDLSNIESEIRRSLQPSRPCPPEYPMGDPLSRWSDGTFHADPEEIEALRNRTNIEFSRFKEGISEIVRASKGQLKVTYTNP